MTEDNRPITTEQLDELQFGRQLHARPIPQRDKRKPTAQQLLDLAEKYERWAKQDDMPEPMAEEYRACAAGLRLLAVEKAKKQPDPVT